MKESEKFVWAPHFYDGVQLVTKSYRNWIGIDTFEQSLVFSKENIFLSHTNIIKKLSNVASTIGSFGIPSLFGEIGIAMDMERDSYTNIPRAYSTDDYSLQLEAALPLINSLEKNMVSFTWWTYVYDNSYKYGDNWNGEDLSIFSKDRQFDKSNLFSGGRILEVLVRPYPVKISGLPLQMGFDPLDFNRRFLFTFQHSAEVSNEFPTEIFVPIFQYPNGFHILVSDGTYKIVNETQTVLYYHDNRYDSHDIEIWSA